MEAPLLLYNPPHRPPRSGRKAVKEARPEGKKKRLRKRQPREEEDEATASDSQSRCFFLGPITSCVVALQTVLETAEPVTLC